MLNIERLNIYRKGLSVERCHTVPHIIPYNNGFHSCNAALIAHELCVLNNLNSASSIRYMLLHDIAEGYTGDIPANVKVNNPDLKSELDLIEARWERLNIPDMPDLSIQEKRISKVADIVELGMYCLSELKLGNKNMIFVLTNVIVYLNKYIDPVKGTQEFIEYLISRGE